MSETEKKAFLSKYENRMIDVVKRINNFVNDLGTDNLVDIGNDFKTLKADFQEFSAYHDQQNKDLHAFSMALEKIELLFTKIDPLLYI